MSNSFSCILIGGKQIGANCLRLLLAQGAHPAFVIPNSDDDGVDSWHESLVRVAQESDVPVLHGKVRDTDVIERIREAKPDVIFAIGGTQIIPNEVLAIPRLGALNIHPALLPKYRGRFSIPHAIFNGERSTGVTAHWLDEGIDSGPIILQESFPISDEDTAKMLYDKFTEVGTKLFGMVLSMLLTGKQINSTPQDENEATYYPKGLPNDGRIDWTWDGATIRRFIRAMTFPPFQPPGFSIGDAKMVIVRETDIR